MRLYKLQPDNDYEIYTGIINDGSQILAGTYNYLCAIIFFNVEGDMLRVEIAINSDADSPDDTVLEKRLQQLNLELGAITVKEFFVENYLIGIRELPKDMEYFLAHEAKFSKEEQVAYHKDIEAWRNGDEFVFHWLNDYWCDSDGYIVAT